MMLEVPKGHQVGIKVPRGGSMCANCKYLSNDEKHCKQENYIKWNGSNKLPEPANEYCCDFWTHDGSRKSLGEQLKSQRARK